MAKKIKKKEDPNLPAEFHAGGAVMAGVISLLLGAVLAFVHLALKPVEIVKEMPAQDDQKSGVIYMVEGQSNEIEGRQWANKEQAVLDQKKNVPIVFNESDLNLWVKSKLKPIDVKGTLALNIAPPNFRISEGKMQIAFENQVTFLGFTGPFVVKMDGPLVKSSDGYVIKPKELYIGGFPTHRIPGMMQAVNEKLWSKFEFSKQLTSVWKNVSDLKMEGNRLAVIFQE